MHVIPKSRMNQTHSHHFFPVSGSGAAKRNATQPNPIGRGRFYALGKGTPIKLLSSKSDRFHQGRKTFWKCGLVVFIIICCFFGGFACMHANLGT